MRFFTLSMTARLPDYNEVQALLMNHKIPVTAAELQGMLMGLYAAGLSPESPDWLTQMYQLITQSNSEQTVLEPVLSALRKHLNETLENHEQGLQLLQPDDDEFIVDRAEALVYWTQGFLLGFQTLSSVRSLTDNTASEAYDDIQQIALLDLDSISEQETDEKDLYALQEHIKISAMIIHQSQLAGNDQAQQTLH